MKQNVLSREYKAVLKSTRFAGAQSAFQKSARIFWKSFGDSIKEIVIDIDGRLDEIAKQRTVSFYDTPGHHLHGAKYICRERIDADSGEREITLKFRHPDRYVSQGRSMAAARRKAGDTKFEEDIKLPFKTLYSFSTTQPISRDKALNRLDDLTSLYPGLRKRLGPVPGDEPIGIVGNFIAREIVVKGGSFEIGRKPKTEAECALIVWYGDDGPADKPVVVEFSFRYGNKREDYERDAALRACAAFATLKESLADWIDTTEPTKTAFIYDR